VQEWLASRLDAIDPGKRLSARDRPLTLLPHCTKRTNSPGTVTDWQTLFAHLGLRLDVPPAGLPRHGRHLRP